MLGPFDVCTVVGVSEVEWRAGCYWFFAAPACNAACFHFGNPGFALVEERPVVTALQFGTALRFVLSVMRWAVASACRVMATGLAADTFGPWHLCLSGLDVSVFIAPETPSAEVCAG